MTSENLQPRRSRQAAMSAREFKALRKTSGLSQARLSAIVGVDRKTMTRWESGKSPVPKYAVFIARVFAAKRQALITGQRPTLKTD